MNSEIARDVELVGRINAVPRILHVVTAMTGLGFAAVVRVTKSEWVACAVRDSVGLGILPGGQLDVATTLCQEVRDTRRVIVMDHASEDSVYCGHPTPKMYGFQSYISVPLFRRGEYFGTLCALDPKPAALKDDKVVEMFTLFAELIGQQLEAEERHANVSAALLDEQQTGELRDQFIAVLGHDLRSPLAAIAMGADALARRARDAEDQRTVERIRRATRRMTSLVEDVMDFARARLGAGFPLARVDTDFDALVRSVVDERASAHPDRTIDVVSDGAVRSVIDGRRMEQLVANLVGNAIEHSPVGTRVTVTLLARGGDITLHVHNSGAPIAEAVRPHLFRPFFRAATGTQGLGLGLYISSQIAIAHGGRIAVASGSDGTTFTLTLPA